MADSQVLSPSSPRVEIALDMVTTYGVNMFKFDGIGFGSGQQHEFMTEVKAVAFATLQSKHAVCLGNCHTHPPIHLALS